RCLVAVRTLEVLDRLRLRDRDQAGLPPALHGLRECRVHQLIVRRPGAGWEAPPYSRRPARRITTDRRQSGPSDGGIPPDAGKRGLPPRAASRLGAQQTGGLNE